MAINSWKNLGIDEEAEAVIVAQSDVKGTQGVEEWVVIQDDELESLTTKIHLINKTLEDHSFSPALLLSAFRFQETEADQVVYWVYLYKKGTFYPFVPLSGQRRDNERELVLKAIVGTDIPVEPDLESWLPPWGLPV